MAVSEDIYEILDRAYESDDPDEIAELTEQALAIDPDNPEALLLKADLTEDDEERLPVLERAIEEARRHFEAEGLEGDGILEDDMGLVYLGLLQRAAFTCFAVEQDGRSFELVEELLRYDHPDKSTAKSLYYRILLERQEWKRVLDETAKDGEPGLGRAYAAVIASFMLSIGKNGKEPDPKLRNMLWDAVRMAPNAPFYMLGYIPDPVDDTESEEECFHFSLLFEDVWPSSREMLNWFSKAAILFGLLTGRFGEESGDMEEILDALGGTPDYKALAHLTESDDSAVIDALSAGGYPKTEITKE